MARDDARWSDPEFLRREQYRDASNLDARVRLHRRHSTNGYGWFEWFFDRLVLPEQSRVLECGCGFAGIWTTNRERIPAGWRCVLTDFSPGMVGAARRNLEGLRGFRFAVADAQALPFPDGSFDTVIANHMLYHVPDRALALAGIRRVLRPGGRLFAATNGDKHLYEMHHGPLADAIREHTGREPLLSTGGLRAFNLTTGREQLDAHFEQVTLEGYPDALEIDEADPLVEYVESMSPVPDNGREPLRKAIAALIEQQGGALRIQKDSGLFVATRGA